MTFQTLQNTAIATITATFNEAFSDYVVPFKLTEEQLMSKIKSDSIHLELSAGAFENNQLTGFILHGFDVTDGMKTAYNAGTGVIPSKRGQQLTTQLYQYAFPLLVEKGIGKIVLEVITINKAAIKVYEAIGFQISRTLNCYKGTIANANIKKGFEIKPLEDYNWRLMQSFWDCKPSWQNAVTALDQLKENNISIGMYDKERLVGYLIFNPAINRVQQFAVDKEYRNKGIGKKLFLFIAANYSKEISLINVDDSAVETNLFLANAGLKKHVMQYEMEMTLK